MTQARREGQSSRRGGKKSRPLTRCRFIAISTDLDPPRRDLGFISSTSSAETPSDFPTACHVLGSYLMSEGNQAQSDAIRDFPSACHVLGFALWMELA